MIQHSWFVSSKGFNVEEIEANSEEQAHQIAKSKTYDKDSTFNKCRYKLICIEKDESLESNYNHDLKKIPKWIRKIFIRTNQKQVE
jgi:hypothetical protein